MLERLVELQRMVCRALKDAGKPWYKTRASRNVPEGRLIARASSLSNLESSISAADGWDHVAIWMTTDDTTENLVMETSYPRLDGAIESDDEVLVFPEMTLYAQIEPTTAKDVQAQPKVAEVPKRPARKLEFI